MYIESVNKMQTATPVVPDITYIPKNNSINSKFSVKVIEIVNTLEKFNKLKNEWINDTAIHSSMSVIYNHPAYKKIINMGKKILPFILFDLRKNDNFWFKALKEISKEDVITPEMQGNFTIIKNEWINWGKSKGFIN